MKVVITSPFSHEMCSPGCNCQFSSTVYPAQTTVGLHVLSQIWTPGGTTWEVIEPIDVVPGGDGTTAQFRFQQGWIVTVQIHPAPCGGPECGEPPEVTYTSPIRMNETPSECFDASSEKKLLGYTMLFDPAQKLSDGTLRVFFTVEPCVNPIDGVWSFDLSTRSPFIYATGVCENLFENALDIDTLAVAVTQENYCEVLQWLRTSDLNDIPLYSAQFYSSQIIRTHENLHFGEGLGYFVVTWSFALKEVITWIHEPILDCSEVGASAMERARNKLEDEFNSLYGVALEDYDAISKRNEKIFRGITAQDFQRLLQRVVDKGRLNGWSCP